MGIIHVKKPANTYCNLFLQISLPPSQLSIAGGKDLYTRAITALNSFSLSLFNSLSLVKDYYFL